MLEMAKNFVLVIGVAAIPIVLWYGFLGIARHFADREGR